jgi:hypothetical protein
MPVRQGRHSVTLRSHTDGKESAQKRHSPGLEYFFSSLPGDPTSILDLAGASQANIGFITGLGHRICSDDITRALDLAFGDGPDFFANQSDPARVERFMSSTLDFHVDELGGALLWDTLQYLSPELLQETLDQLFHIVAPGSSMLAYFQTDERTTVVPVYSYRIVDPCTVQLATKGKTRPAQYFNNRALEKLFQRFTSVKFFLSRDHLREVIVKR